MKYIFTNSMTRSERCTLATKIYNELYNSGRHKKETLPLVKVLKTKKKKALYGGKKVSKPFASTMISHMGAKVYIIMNATEGFDTIVNTSPTDAGYVEYVRVIPNGMAILYTQHSLDRYNERVHSNKYTTHRDMIQSIIINNPVKGGIARDKEGDSNKVVQRLGEGFLLGSHYADENYIVFNTFYDNEEYKDDDMKGRTRNIFNKKDNLTNAQINEYDRLLESHSIGNISLGELEKQATLKGYI